MKLWPLILVIYVSVLASCKKNNTSETAVNTSTDTTYITALSKGVNLSNWFNDYSDHAQFGNRFTDAHFVLLKQLGFTYVRIPIGQNVMFQPNDPSHLNAVNLAYVDGAVQRAIDHGLAVTINYHTASDEFETTLPTNTANQDKLASYWKAVADHFKKFSTSQLFFEVYNEPHVASTGLLPASITKSWWTPVQKKLIDAIRSETSDHFIIAGGEGWNSTDGLKQLTPYKAHNIIYNFHFYEPFVFTHQGATWAGPTMDKLRNVPYPSSPEAVAPIIDTTSDADVINYLTGYGNDHWDKQKLEGAIMEAVNWANANNAAIICNEFGSYKPFAPRQSRLDLINDVRSIFEAHHIGWAMWEMDEGFGFIDYPGSDRNVFTTDDGVLHALGLK